MSRDSASCSLSKAKAQGVPPGYKRTEVGLIPEEWTVELLGNLFTFKNGLNKAKRFFGVGTPIVNYMDVFTHSGLRNAQVKGRVSLTASEIRNFDVRRGDVFFTRTSETLDEIGMTAVMLDDPPNTVFSGFVLRGRPTDTRLEDRYKQYCFLVNAVRQQIVSAGTYTTRALTNGRSLSAVRIPIPSISEQRAIAQALSDVDELLGAMDALIAKKRELKQAAMQQLLTGRTRLPGFHGEWVVRRLGAIAEVVMGQSPSSAHYNIRGDGLPLIQGNADVANRKTIARVFTTHVTRTARAGDVLLSVRAPVGEVSRATFDACLGRGVCAIRFPNDFLYHYLMFLEPTWAKHSKGSTFDSVNSDDIKAVEIDLPMEDDEQAAIVAVLSDMDAEIAALEARCDKTRDLKQAMMQELLTGRTRLVKPSLAHA